MSRHHCLRVLVGGPPERRLLDILDRFSSAGWVVIYARKPDQAREIVEAQLADVALLHPGMGGAMPSGSKLPLVLLGADPLSVLERKVQAASSTGAGDRLSALRYARTATPTPGVTPATPAQARGGFTGSGRVIPPNAPGTAERRGELRTTPLAVLLLDAAFERCTGVLSLRVGEIQRSWRSRTARSSPPPRTSPRSGSGRSSCARACSPTPIGRRSSRPWSGSPGCPLGSTCCAPSCSPPSSSSARWPSRSSGG